MTGKCWSSTSSLGGLRERAAELLEGGEAEMFVNAVTLSETLYVVSRIYGAAGLPDPNGEAYRYVLWIKGRARLVGVDEELALRAGELKKELGIALPDCYVIATAEKLDATALFRSVEAEMRGKLGLLRSLNVAFLEEIKPPG